MIIQRAAEAEAVFAITRNSGNNPRKILFFNLTLDSKLAVRSRTPFESFKVVDICPGEKFVVSNCIRGQNGTS
jgi:hypothetical protein